MRATIPLVVLLLSVFLVTGCGDDEDFRCPLLSDNVSWNSYDGYDFEQEGPESTARRIVSECGWHVFGGHNGGSGDTLQVASPNEEVVFVWAFNDFLAFRLIEGWIGETRRGAKLGDHTTVFHNLYPDFTIVDESLSTLEVGDLNVEAYFDADGFLEQLLVGRFFRS